MQFDEALRQISDIRLQMARGQVCREFRAATVGLSGFAGLLAAALQPWAVPAPASDPAKYLGFWVCIAAVCAAMAGVEILSRPVSGLSRRQTMLAVEQFVPSFLVGGLLTAWIFRSEPALAWTLPGLWSTAFGVGIFAASKHFPRGVLWVGLFYVLCGVGCLEWGRGVNAFSPWLMAISFGGGQLFAAVVLYRTLERNHDSQAE